MITFVIYNNKYSLHVVDNVIFSFNAQGSIKTLETTILDVLKFDNIITNTITNIHYMLLTM